MIPFLNLRDAYLELKTEIDAAIMRVLDSGWYIQGEETAAFEAEWAKYCGATYSIGVANGLDALVLSLRALEIGPGDEVIVPSNTFIATWLAVSAVGARPIPVEPDPLTYNIDPLRIESSISVRTRAIIPVHLYGQPADLEAILAIAKNRGLYVIEDAAQAHGAKYHGKRIGTHGDVVCWSFYPGKNLGALGDGGGITTDNHDIANRIRVLANYGSSEKYIHTLPGLNSRLDPIQATVLRVKLRYIDAWAVRRSLLAQSYSALLKDTDLVLPKVSDYVEHAWHLYVVRSKDRAKLQEKLSDAGIGTQIHYPVPPHMQAAYSNLGFDPGAFPIAQKQAAEVISLPMGPQTPAFAPEVVRDVLQSH